MAQDDDKAAVELSFKASGSTTASPAGDANTVSADQAAAEPANANTVTADDVANGAALKVDATTVASPGAASADTVTEDDTAIIRRLSTEILSDVATRVVGATVAEEVADKKTPQRKRAVDAAAPEKHADEKMPTELVVATPDKPKKTPEVATEIVTGMVEEAIFIATSPKSNGQRIPASSSTPWCTGSEAQIHLLERSCKALRAAMASAAEREADLLSRLAQAEKSLAQCQIAKAESVALREELEKMRRNTRSAEARSTALEGRATALQHKLDTSLETSKARKQLDSKHGSVELELLEAAKTAAQQQCSILEEQKKKCEQERREMVAQVAEARSAQAGKEKSMTRFQQNLSQRVSFMEGEISKHKSERDHAHYELAKVRSTHAETEQYIQTLMDEKSEIRKQCMDLQNKEGSSAVHTEQNLQELQQENAEIQERVKHLEATSCSTQEDAEDKIKQLQQQKAEVLQRLEGFEAAASSTQEQMDKKLSQLLQEKVEVQQRYENLEQIMRSSESQSQKDLVQLQQANEAAQQKSADSSGAAMHLEVEKGCLQAEVAALTTSLKTMEEASMVAATSHSAAEAIAAAELEANAAEVKRLEDRSRILEDNALDDNAQLEELIRIHKDVVDQLDVLRAEQSVTQAKMSAVHAELEASRTNQTVAGASASQGAVDAELEDLATAHEEALVQLQTLSTSYSEALCLLENEEAEAESLRQLHLDAEMVNGNAVAQKDQLLTELHEYKEGLERARCQQREVATQLKADLGRAQDDFNKLGAELDIVKSLKEQFLNDSKMLAAEGETLKQTVKALEDSLGKQKLEKDQMFEDYHQMEKGLLQEKEEKQRILDKCNAVEKEVSECQQKVEEVTSHANAQSAERAEMERKLLQVQQEIQCFSKSNQEMEHELAGLRSEAHTLSAEKAEIQRNAMQLEQQFEQKLSHLQNEAQTLSADKAQMEQKMVQLEQEVKQWKEKAHQVAADQSDKVELETAVQRINSLEAEFAQCQNVKDQAQRSLLQLRKENAAMKHQSTCLESELAILRESKVQEADAVAEQNFLRDELNQARAAEKAAQQRVASLEAASTQTQQDSPELIGLQQKLVALEAEVLQSKQCHQEEIQAAMQQEQARMTAEMQKQAQEYVASLTAQFAAKEAATQKSMQEQAQQYVSGMNAHIQALEAKYQAELEDLRKRLEAKEQELQQALSSLSPQQAKDLREIPIARGG